MQTQASILKELRNGYQFDALEKILYVGNLVGLKALIENKVNSVKASNPNADTKDQEKMVMILTETIRWVEVFYIKSEEHAGIVRGEINHIADLHRLNEQLQKKIEELENRLSLNEKINSL